MAGGRPGRLTARLRPFDYLKQTPSPSGDRANRRWRDAVLEAAFTAPPWVKENRLRS